MVIKSKSSWSLYLLWIYWIWIHLIWYILIRDASVLILVSGIAPILCSFTDLLITMLWYQCLWSLKMSARCCVLPTHKGILGVNVEQWNCRTWDRFSSASTEHWDKHIFVPLVHQDLHFPWESRCNSWHVALIFNDILADTALHAQVGCPWTLLTILF